MQIHLYRDGTELGKYSLDAITAGLSVGSIVPSDLAWHEGASDWRPLGVTLTSLFRLPASDQVAGVPVGAASRSRFVFRDLLSKYQNHAIGINSKEPKAFAAAELIALHDEFFSIFVRESGLTIHFPYRRIVQVLEAESGVSMGTIFTKEYPVVVEVLHQIVYSGAVGISLPL